jgi:hypothetical protein
MPSIHPSGNASLKSGGGAVPKKSLLDNIAERSGYVIFEAKSKRFLDFTPNKITICPNRITIVYNNFFGKDEYPLPIENVIGARINRGFASSSLIIETFGYEKPEPFSHMSTRDARLARRYILALVECKKSDINLLDYGIEELRKKLSEIGTVRYDSEAKHTL